MPARSHRNDPRDDRDLVRCAEAGDSEARECLGRRLGCIRRFLVTMDRRRGSSLTAEQLDDLTQDVTVEVLRVLSRFQGRARLETWIWQICRSRHLNRLRDLGRRPASATLVEDPESGPSDRAEAEAEEVHGALVRLGPPEEDVLRLKAWEGLCFPEIAERLGMPLGTVKTAYYRGLKRLQHELREDPRGVAP